MRRLFFVAAMAAMLCAACTEGIDEVSTTAEFDTFSATVNTTRTDMGDDYSVLWNEGDLVTIFNKTTDNLQYEAVNVNDSSTDLKHKSGVRGTKTLDHNYAIYPYDAAATLSGEVLSTSIAAEQTYVADSDLHHAVMVAKSAETSLNFSNATSLLRCHLNTIIGGTTLKSIKVVSQTTDIAGKVTIDMANGTVAEVVDGEGVKEIILDCDDVELPTSGYTIFNIALAAGTFPADDLKYIYTVKIDGVERSFEYPIKKEVTFEAGAFRQTKFTFSESFDGNTSEAISYAEAIAEVLNSGQDVTLEKDVVLTEPLTISGTATLNLNGKTISANFTDKDNEAVIYNTGSLTLAGNGTIKNSAENGAPAINNSGDLTLDGVTIKGAPLADGGHSEYAVVSSGNMTIEEGTIISAERGSIQVTGAGETVINGGTFTNEDIGSRSLTSHVVDVKDGSTHKLTINGGTFQHLHANTSGGVVICNRTKGTVYVNGGNFSGGNYYGNDNLSDYGYGGTFSVTGGTYSASPAAKYLATGYLTFANDNGTYTVKAGVKLDNIADFEAALNNATPGSTIVLPANISETITVSEMKDVIIEGNENTTMIFATNANTKIENVTLKKINFEYTGATTDCGVVINENAQIDNLVLEGCTFTGTGAKAGRGLSGKNDTASIVISNCTFKDMGYPIYAWGGYESLTLENCTFNNIKSWAIMPQSGFNGDLTVNKCKFIDCLGGGLIKAGNLTAGHTFTFTNNTITGCTIAGDHNWFQFNVSAGTSVISGNTKDGAAWTPSDADGLKQ